MAQVAMIAGLGMMCLSSSVGAALMMGGEEDGGAGGAGAGGTNNQDSTPILPSGQYVKLVHTNLNQVINLAELEVFASGGTTNLAAAKSVTSSAFHPVGPLPNLVDGNMTNMAHTMNEIANTGDSMLINLGSVQEIEKIKITNRVDCCKERAIGIKAQILGSDGTTVVKETPAITTTADTYTFTFPGTAWA